MAIVILAKNQEGVAAGLNEYGAARILGRSDSLTTEDIAADLKKLICDGKARATMSAIGKGIVDGSGAMRVVRAMKEKSNA